MQLQQGTLLQGGKYKIERVLGQGGFGITYLAENTMLEGKVAIKEFFFKEYCDRDEATCQVTIGTKGNRDLVNRFKQKFIKEARTIFKLNHPNIVRILDIFEENGTAYYVMDYIEGESLGDMVKRRGSIPEAEAISYIKEVASALSYIHSEKINHLDIKPGNIMKRGKDNKILVIDFGVAKQYDAETAEGTTTTPVGISHGYSPTEQYQRHGVQTFSPQSDVYAMAATLYKLLTGITPPEAIEIQDQGLPLEPLETKHISGTVIAAITNAMKSRAQRTQNIALFLADLAVTDNENTVVVVPEPASKPKSSKFKVTMILFALVLVAGVIIGNIMFSDCKISEPSGTTNGYDWVDLGLPSGTKWATMNVGADSPSDYGNYYAWGETSPKSSYDIVNYKYRISGESEYEVKFSKYVTNSQYGNIDGKTELDPSDDAAYMNWGPNWRIPSVAQIEELCEKCKWIWTSLGGHKGCRVVGPNGNSIFLPASGDRIERELWRVGDNGYYLSREFQLEQNEFIAYDLDFYSGRHIDGPTYRWNGTSIRPVLDPISTK